MRHAWPYLRCYRRGLILGLFAILEANPDVIGTQELFVMQAEA